MLTELELVPAWTALMLGIFAIFAGIGELRMAGHWQKMIAEIHVSPALQVVTALIELTIGALVWLANPWASPDWLASAMNVVGGLMVLEALLILAFSDVYMAFWLRRFGPLSRVWVACSLAFGVALVAAAMPRFV